MARQIVGVQLHHSVTLDDATRFLANGATALAAVAERTDDPGLRALADQAKALSRDAGHRRAVARDRLLALRDRDPERFARCRDGAEPWPDENPDGFVARCTCHDRCLHEQGIEPGPRGVCNCPDVKPACPQHEAA